MSVAVKKAAAARATVASSVEALREELRQLDARREELVERREQLQAAPIDRETAERRVDDLVQALAAGADLPGSALIEPGGYAEVMRELTAIPLTTGPAAQPPTNPWAVLAAIVPDALAAALRQQVMQAYDRLPAPLSAEERRAALAAIDRELAHVEQRAAEAWWQAQDVGIDMLPPEVSGEALAGLAA